MYMYTEHFVLYRNNTQGHIHHDPRPWIRQWYVL